MVDIMRNKGSIDRARNYKFVVTELENENRCLSCHSGAYHVWLPPLLFFVVSRRVGRKNFPYPRSRLRIWSRHLLCCAFHLSALALLIFHFSFFLCSLINFYIKRYEYITVVYFVTSSLKRNFSCLAFLFPSM